MFLSDACTAVKPYPIMSCSYAARALIRSASPRDTATRARRSAMASRKAVLAPIPRNGVILWSASAWPVTGRCRSILEAGVNVALRIVLESNKPLTVMNNIVEPFAEDATQCGAAHRQLAVGFLGVTVLQVDGEQTIQTVIEKRHAFARLGGVRD